MMFKKEEVAFTSHLRRWSWHPRFTEEHEVGVPISLETEWDVML